MNDKQLYIDFEAYERVAEPHKREKASAWRTAIGLQDVDGLKVSDYLKETAVFIIKYLRSCGFKVNNDLFAYNSWYFRNALIRANYRNPSKNIQPDKSFLIKFFRNLLLGEQNELKNRYMLLGYVDSIEDTPTSTPTSTPASTNVLQPSSKNVLRLVKAIGNSEMSVKEMMEKTGLKDRKNFLEYSLNPAINEGFVQMKYPNSPRHPRQRYLLTVKGLILFEKVIK